LSIRGRVSCRSTPKLRIALRKVNKPILLVANKTDSPTMDTNADEFRQLGRGWLVRVSVMQNRNKDELLELIAQRLPIMDTSPEEIEPPTMKVAIVGRRNVGKSTFVNTLAHAQRMIVSEVPGTTRDSVDVMFELDGHKFMAIDTPGLRRNKSIRTDIDWYGAHRAQRSIRRADVVLMFFDCKVPMSKVDKQLAHYISDEFKPCIFVVNKWDQLAGQMPTERWVRYVRENFPTMAYCPIAFVTGMTGKNVKALLNHAQMLFKQAQDRVSTSMLNKLVKAALERHEPPLYQLKRPKIYYATQVATAPPTIVLVCNNALGFPSPYRRYLLGFLRDHLPSARSPSSSICSLANVTTAAMRSNTMRSALPHRSSRKDQTGSEVDDFYDEERRVRDRRRNSRKRRAGRRAARFSGLSRTQQLGSKPKKVAWPFASTIALDDRAIESPT
jgi:GTPase